MSDPHSVAHATNAAAHWAVVIDAGPDATRINQASADSCLTRPALPYYEAEPDYRWADGVAAALGKIATKAGITLAGRHILVADDDSQNQPKQAREWWTLLLFEQLQASTIYIGARSSLAVYTTGKTSGVACDTHRAIPMCDGVLFEHAVKRLDGDGSTAIARAAYDAAKVLESDLDVMQSVLENVVLTGRPAEELAELVPQVQAKLSAIAAATPHDEIICGQRARHLHVTVRAAPHGMAASWFGGSLCASLDPGKGMWIRRAEFEAEGAKVVHRKCPL